MILEVSQKEQNSGLVTKQTESPFQSGDSIEEFQSNEGNTTAVIQTINYEPPTTGKITNF